MLSRQRRGGFLEFCGNQVPGISRVLKVRNSLKYLGITYDMCLLIQTVCSISAILAFSDHDPWDQHGINMGSTWDQHAKVTLHVLRAASTPLNWHHFKTSPKCIHDHVPWHWRKRKSAAFEVGAVWQTINHSPQHISKFKSPQKLWFSGEFKHIWDHVGDVLYSGDGITCRPISQFAAWPVWHKMNMAQWNHIMKLYWLELVWLCDSLINCKWTLYSLLYWLDLVSVIVNLFELISWIFDTFNIN